MSKPVAVGRVYGPQEWTEPELVEAMKKPKIEKPEKKPEKHWKGYEEIRNSKEIRDEKERFNWDEVVKD